MKIHTADYNQELVIIHCTGVILSSTGKASPLARGRGLFFRTPMLVGETKLVAGISEAFWFSKLVTTSGNEETATIPSQLLALAPLIANSESCSLAVSSSGDSKAV